MRIASSGEGNTTVISTSATTSSCRILVVSNGGVMDGGGDASSRDCLRLSLGRLASQRQLFTVKHQAGRAAKPSSFQDGFRPLQHVRLSNNERQREGIKSAIDQDLL